MKPITTFVLKALLLTVAVVSCNEAAWRATGLRPTIRDTSAMWSKVRRECDGSPTKVALLGTSRFQLGLNPETLARVLPSHEFCQLAVSGSNPLPVLEDLAHDANFNGTAIVEILLPWPWTRPQAWPVHPGTEFLRYSRQESFGGRIENDLQVFAEQHLAFLHPEARFWLAAGNWLRSGSIQGPGQYMDLHRAIRNDFQRVDREERINESIRLYLAWKQQTALQESTETFQRISAWSDQIKARGGQVIFFRMVAAGRLLAFEDQTWPVDLYLKPFAESQTSPVISFQDDVELTGFHCADGSHLAARDADRFSEAFARMLQRRGLLH